MILCKSCDAEVQPGQTFCVNCGARTEGNTYSTSDPPANAPSAGLASSSTSPASTGTSTAPAVPVVPSLPPTTSAPPTTSPPPYNPAGGYSPPLTPSLDQPNYQPAHTYQGQGSYPTTVPNSSLAVASLVCGILGWTFLPFLSSIAAVVLGHMGRREIRESGGRLSGDGMAIAGLILGYSMLGIAIVGCGLIFMLALFGAAVGAS